VRRKVCRIACGVATVLFAATALIPARSLALPVASLPGDADCDGLVTAADLGHLSDELTDGDGDNVNDVDGGSVVSCTGADANGDGLVTVADLSALTRLLYGQESLPGPSITFLGIAGADGTPATLVGDMPVPVFQTVSGLGFYLVVEGAPGPSNLPVGAERSDLATRRPGRGVQQFGRRKSGGVRRGRRAGHCTGELRIRAGHRQCAQ